MVDPETGYCSPADKNPNIRRSVVNDHSGVKYIQTEVMNTGMAYYSPQSARDSFKPRSRQEIEARHRELVIFRASVSARMAVKRRRQAKQFAPTIPSLNKKMAGMSLDNTKKNAMTQQSSEVDCQGGSTSSKSEENASTLNKEQLTIVTPDNQKLSTTNDDGQAVTETANDKVEQIEKNCEDVVDGTVESTKMKGKKQLAGKDGVLTPDN